MIDDKKRRNWGFAGSAVIHILIVLVISFTGLLHFSHAQENIVEVTFFGGGGGGGGSDDAGLIEEAEPEAAAAEETPDSDAIFETNKEKPAVIKKQQVKHIVKNSGKGKGTGQGSGTGSGIGPGSGSGSGGGHGSGYGTGTGSGNGPGSGSGSGITSSPAVPPRIIKSYQPSYPSAERNAGIEGTVSIKFLIGTDGSVEDITITSSSGNANLDNAAANACRKWRFTAAKNSSGQPVRCYASIPITFKIRN